MFYIYSGLDRIGLDGFGFLIDFTIYHLAITRCGSKIKPKDIRSGQSTSAPTATMTTMMVLMTMTTTIITLTRNPLAIEEKKQHFRQISLDIPYQDDTFHYHCRAAQTINR